MYIYKILYIFVEGILVKKVLFGDKFLYFGEKFNQWISIEDVLFGFFMFVNILRINVVKMGFYVIQFIVEEKGILIEYLKLGLLENFFDVV